MRIISGKYKGRVIKMSKGIRPTQDKVRKALFDILGNMEGLSFLDLFAGSGAVGLEAVSSGAKKVVFVENNPACLKILKNNLTCLLPTTYYLLPLDVSGAIKKLAQDRLRFDIIFLDPPYYKDLAPRLRSGSKAPVTESLALQLRSVPMVSVVEPLAKKTLQILGAYDILAADGLIAVQHFKKDNLPANPGVFVLFKQSRYGDTTLSFYKKLR